MLNRNIKNFLLGNSRLITSYHGVVIGCLNRLSGSNRLSSSNG